MKIVDKIKMDRKGLTEYGPITIVAFGDSVTHGAVGPGEIDYETVYHNRLRKKINGISNYVPVNVINAGIGGITAKGSLGRMESQVFAHNPDLIIVCFGLNDVNGTLENYLSSLKAIFERCNEECIDTIFMTPNMLNTYVAEDTEYKFLDYAAKTAQLQLSGNVDMFMSEACKLAESMNIKVCDCYKAWKKLSETQDTTKLLANRINHPTREMHNLFADMLFDTIFSGVTEVVGSDNNTMWNNKE